MRIFDEAGNEIASQNDWAGGNLYPALTLEMLPAGVYYIGLSSYANTAYDPHDGSQVGGGNSTGDYRIRVSLRTPDPDGVVQGATHVDLTSPDAVNPNSDLIDQGVYVTNGFLDQQIGWDTRPGLWENPSQELDPDAPHAGSTPIYIGAADVDFYRIIAPDSGTFFVQIDTAGYGSEGIDSFIEIFTVDAEGDLISVSSNDNRSEDSTESFLEIEVSIGGIYYVAVTTAGNQDFDPQHRWGRSSTTDETGRYDVFFSFSNRDVNGTAFGAVDFANFDVDGNGIIDGSIGEDFGTPLLGVNDGFKDVDFIRYTASEAGLLEISILQDEGQATADWSVLGIWELAGDQLEIVRIVDTTNRSPRAVVEVAEGQTLWISVSGRGNAGFHWSAPGSGSGGEVGDYRLSIQQRPLAELASLTNNSIAHPSPRGLTLGEIHTGNIGFDGHTFVGRGDVDMFSYTPPVDQFVRIQTLSHQEGSADTILRVFDANGQELAFNNNAHAGTKNSELSILLQAGQTYFIGVSGNGSGSYDPLTGSDTAPGSTGGYALRMTESPPPIYAASVDAGGPPLVRVFDARDGSELASFMAYDPSFRGGVRVAIGDVTGDGIDDIVTVPGPGGGPHIRVFDGATLQLLGGSEADRHYNFFAYMPGMKMGLNIAVGDVNNDGFADIITAPDAGSSPAVKIFSGADGRLLHSFFAYNPDVSGGVRVAAGDVTGDGAADIITVPGPGFPAHVRVFAGRSAQAGVGIDMLQSRGLRIGSFFAFPGFRGGAYVAAGDLNGDQRADVILGAGAGGGPHVQAFNAANDGPMLLQSFFAYASSFRGGVRVATSEVSLNNRVEIITAPGPGGGPHIRLFDPQASQPNLANQFPFPGFRGGIFVTGSGIYRHMEETQTTDGDTTAFSPANNSITLANAETTAGFGTVVSENRDSSRNENDISNPPLPHLIEEESTLGDHLPAFQEAWEDFFAADDLLADLLQSVRI